MKNKVVKKLMMIVMAVTMLSGFSFATVYANADPCLLYTSDAADD